MQYVMLKYNFVVQIVFKEPAFQGRVWDGVRALVLQFHFAQGKIFREQESSMGWGKNDKTLCISQ